MKNHNHLISLLLFLVGVGIRFASALAGDINALNIAFYISLGLGILFLAIDSFGTKRYAYAFVVKNRFHLNIFSLFASIGFFVDFVYSAIAIFYSIDDMSYMVLTSFVPLCISCVMALLSSFYFVLVASFFGGSNYDFRQLKFFHIVPLVWSVSKALGILGEAVSVFQSDASVLRYLAVLFSLGAFFFLVTEIENTDGTKSVTVFFVRSLYFTGVMYFINELMLLLGGSVHFSVEDGLFGVTVLFISGFMYFCEKNIISHTRLEV